SVRVELETTVPQFGAEARSHVAPLGRALRAIGISLGHVVLDARLFDRALVLHVEVLAGEIVLLAEQLAVQAALAGHVQPTTARAQVEQRAVDVADALLALGLGFRRAAQARRIHRCSARRSGHLQRASTARTARGNLLRSLDRKSTRLN